jgi:hypothetical protein
MKDSLINLEKKTVWNNRKSNILSLLFCVSLCVFLVHISKDILNFIFIQLLNFSFSCIFLMIDLLFW